MRLTLRTLLAWLDGLLSAEDQQVLADKVAASPVAPTLVRRIQDVVENAALAAPRIDARGLADDTNSVAEYLDNCLPADRLEAFERICIESDVHLAEVASCHGVLAEMSREAEAAAPIDATTCKRLLAAVRPRPRRVAAIGGGHECCRRAPDVRRADGRACPAAFKADGTSAAGAAGSLDLGGSRDRVARRPGDRVRPLAHDRKPTASCGGERAGVGAAGSSRCSRSSRRRATRRAGARAASAGRAGGPAGRR